MEATIMTLVDLLLIVFNFYALRWLFKLKDRDALILASTVVILMTLNNIRFEGCN